MSRGRARGRAAGHMGRERRRSLARAAVGAADAHPARRGTAAGSGASPRASARARARQICRHQLSSAKPTRCPPPAAPPPPSYKNYGLTALFKTSTDKIDVTTTIDNIAPGLKAAINATLPDSQSGAQQGFVCILHSARRCSPPPQAAPLTSLQIGLLPLAAEPCCQ